MIEVVDYDPGWPGAFELLRQRIWPAVVDCARVIEHVGSTSIPGLAAKPIIDLDIVVATQPDLHLAIKRVKSLGYRHLGEFGVAGREAFRPLDGDRSHNLYACVAGNSALNDHLTFRDYLRAHPETAAEYGTLKKRLAGRFPNDMEAYVDGKTEFVLSVLARAGISSGRLAEIKAENPAPTRAPGSASPA